MKVTKEQLKQLIKEEVLSLFEAFEGTTGQYEKETQMSLPKSWFRGTRTPDQTMGARVDVATGEPFERVPTGPSDLWGDGDERSRAVSDPERVEPHTEPGGTSKEEEEKMSLARNRWHNYVLDQGTLGPRSGTDPDPDPFRRQDEEQLREIEANPDLVKASGKH